MNDTRTKKIGYLNFGPPSLSMIWCKKCGADTLHKNFGECNHCGTRITQAPLKAQMINGRMPVMPPAIRRKLVVAMQNNRGKTYGKFAEELGYSVSLVKKIAKEYGITRR